MKFKRRAFFSLLFLCFICCALLCACGTQPTDDPAPSANAAARVSLIENGIPRYAIVYPASAGKDSVEARLATQTKQALETVTRKTFSVYTDSTPEGNGTGLCEIVIGNTNRAVSKEVSAALVDEGEYMIHVCKDKIAIVGNSDYATVAAVNDFLKTHVGWTHAEDYSISSNISLDASLVHLDTATEPAAVKTVYLIQNIRGINGFTNNEDWNDIVRFYTCLQGRLNKNAITNGFALYQMYDGTDQFWLDYISGEGKLLDGCTTVSLSSWSELWSAFSAYILEAGIVLWDPDVPATANVASTVCSVDGHLPVRYDTDANSLYTWLTKKGVPVKVNLVDKFTGKSGSTIPDTSIASTGSIKCDPYLWALEKYGDRVNSGMIAYVLDGASQVATNPIYQRAAAGTAPNANQLYSHDYYIYNECFFVDLTCKADEAPCDDPSQPMGSDAKTLGKVLAKFQQRNGGKFGKLMGFPPWYMKYTRFNNWGTSGEVQLEWAFVAFITQYDFIKEADAWSPSWMTNASLYCQYTSDTVYENNPAPASGSKTFNRRTRYFTVYIGDYDSSAWLKMMVPDCFESPQRGQIPMMWAFNPNLSDRVPMIFDYVYENKTANDYFVTGDSGAGYVFPSRLADLQKWVDYNEPYLEKFDMDIVGFIIDDTQLSEATMAAYAEIAPRGAFTNAGSSYLTILNDKTVFMNMYGSFQPGDNTDATRAGMYAQYANNGTNFAAFRTVRQYTPDIIGFVNDFISYAKAKNDGYNYEYVDMYTLFDLILQSGQGKHIYY